MDRIVILQRRRKQVRWNPTVKVYLLEPEDRKSEWMTFATDRYRFQTRIQQTAEILDPILIEKTRQIQLQRLQI